LLLPISGVSTMGSRGRRLLVTTLVLTGATYAVAAAGLIALWELREYSRPPGALALATGPQSTIVLDRHDRPVFRFHTEDRSDVPLDRISIPMLDALLAVEDKRFYSHHGLDAVRMMKAALVNVRAARIVEGGSTITQQLARSLLLTPERTYRRKLREVFLATQIERRFDKRAILAAYLNRMYFGDGYYGVEAASRGYFAKSAADLTAAEAALLAGLVNSPRRYSPTAAPDRARERRDLVLRLMRQQGKLDDASLRAALAEPVAVIARQTDERHLERDADDEPCGLYFKEEVRRALVARVGVDRALNGGLRVHTTLDLPLQCEAERVMRDRLAELARLRGRGAPDGEPLQGSLVTIDPRTGFVLAMVGGSDFHLHRYNRATQARRQPGSAFKPLVFAAAVERGFMPFSLISDLDRPIDAVGGPWLPADDHEGARFTLRRALAVSSNRASAQLLREVGVGPTIALSQRLGIASPLPAVPSLALGTGEVTLLELAAAYTAFANQGLVSPPTIIRRIEDRERRTIWQNEAAPRRALGSATAFLVTSMLQDVVTGGTASGARAFGFTRPAAGKTGTTDDYTDAWFIGYTPRLLTGVWFGFDTPAPIMRRGFAATVAVPAWARFMKVATHDDPVESFRQPPDVERIAVCRTSGMRATDACRYAPAFAQVTLDERGVLVAPATGVYEDFAAAGSVPYETCPIHSTAAGAPVIGAARPVSDPKMGDPGRVTHSGLSIAYERGADGILRTIVRQVPAVAPVAPTRPPG
jgi:penicillin-binding protein 2D